MGAWGYDALDSDGALDWIGNNITDQINAAVDQLIIDWNVDPETYTQDVRGAAKVVEHLCRLDYLGVNLEPSYILLRNALRRIESDEFSWWHQIWDQPEEIQGYVQIQRQQMENALIGGASL